MRWRDQPDSAPLSHQERQTLTRLLDCHPDLQALQQANRRGDFEQESLGPPDLQGWPFYGILQKEHRVEALASIRAAGIGCGSDAS